VVTDHLRVREPLGSFGDHGDHGRHGDHGDHGGHGNVPVASRRADDDDAHHAPKRGSSRSGYEG
jgi:hypothetical protein